MQKHISPGEVVSPGASFFDVFFQLVRLGCMPLIVFISSFFLSFAAIVLVVSMYPDGAAPIWPLVVFQPAGGMALFALGLLLIGLLLGRLIVHS
jgi:hypothetical protein